MDMATNCWILWLLLAFTLLVIVPIAYSEGKKEGAETMRRSILRHPSVRARREANQFDRVA